MTKFVEIPQKDKWQIFAQLTLEDLKNIEQAGIDEDEEVKEFLKAYPQSAHSSGIFSNPKVKTYQDSNQLEWNRKSLKVVHKLASALSNNNNKPALFDLLKIAGDERKKIGEKLKHNHSTEFGKFRAIDTKPTEMCAEIITRTGVWKHLFDTINDELDENISNDREGKFFTKVEPLEGNIPHTDREWDVLNISSHFSSLANRQGNPPEINEFIHHYMLLMHYKFNTGVLPSLSIKEIQIDKLTYGAQEIIYIIYPLLSAVEMMQKIQDIQPLLDVTLACDVDAKEEFKKNLGYLAYELYRLLPLRRGTSAAVNWIIRAIAETKSIELGHEKIRDIPLDFKAFITPTREEYGAWYKENAFDFNIDQNDNAHELTW